MFDMQATVREMREMKKEALDTGNCVARPIGCGMPGPHKFRDELSAREYRISGLCQRCQDYVFGPTLEDERGYEDE